MVFPSPTQIISQSYSAPLSPEQVQKAHLKYNNPDRKRVAEWLKEYDQGLYSNLPSMYTQEELKKNVQT